MHSNVARRNAVAAATAGPTLVLRHLRTVETRALLSQKKVGDALRIKINVQNSDMAATILTSSVKIRSADRFLSATKHPKKQQNYQQTQPEQTDSVGYAETEDVLVCRLQEPTQGQQVHPD